MKHDLIFVWRCLQLADPTQDARGTGQVLREWLVDNNPTGLIERFMLDARYLRTVRNFPVFDMSSQTRLQSLQGLLEWMGLAKHYRQHGRNVA